MDATEIQRLNPDLIRVITGERELEALQELEIVFTPIQEIDGLQRCINLQASSMIDCGLTRISNLWCVRDTLERLCLCQQSLTKIENLDLPHLKELFLHQNAITRIEGLEGCPRLQRLWLSSNKIEKLENLHCLASLRELWVQENRISSLSGLDSLVHLENLALAGNPITEFKEVQRLTVLPSLATISFSDPHFGDCPIMLAEGYWNFMLCYLKKVRCMDGVEVSGAERDAAEEAYMEQVLQFNEKIEQVEREHEREIAEIESRRRKNMSHAKLLRSKMLASFTELEALVQEGRNSILQEHARQRRVREKNLARLESVLAELEKKHADEVDRRTEEAQRALTEEEAAFKHYLAKIEAERDQDLFICQLHYGSQGKVACQELCRASADFSYLAHHFLEGQAGMRHPEHKWQLLRVYRMYNETLMTSFQQPAASASNHPHHSAAAPPPERVFFCAKPDLLKTTCTLGFSANEGDGAGLLLLCSDPVAAWQLAYGTSSSSATSAGRDKAATLATLLICRAHVHDAAHVSLSWDGTPDTLPGLLQAGLSRFPAAASVLRVSYRRDHAATSGHAANGRKHHDTTTGGAAGGAEHPQSSSSSPFFLLLRRRAARLVLPEYHALCGDPAVSGAALRRMEEVLEDLTLPVGRGAVKQPVSHRFALPTPLLLPPRGCGRRSLVPKASGGPQGGGGGGGGGGEDLLARLEQQLDSEVALYVENLWEEVEPEAGHRLRTADAQVKQREEMLRQVRSEIVEERSGQESLLRQMKAAGGARGAVLRGGIIDRPDLLL